MNRSSDRSIGDVNHQHDSSDYYCGNAQFLSLSYVEVIPLPHFHHHHHDNHDAAFSPPPPSPPSLTGAFIKRQFIIDTHRSMILSHSGCRDTSNMMVMKNPTIKVIPSNDTDRRDQHLITGLLVMAATDSGSNDDDDDANIDDSVLWCRTNEPFGPWTEWPCQCVGYALVNHPIDRSLHTIFTTTTTSLPHASSSRPVMVSESTLVIIRREENDTNHIRIPRDDSFYKYDISQWKDQFTGELPTRSLSTQQQQERSDTVSLHFKTQNATTIAELKFRMRQLIAEPIYIGTTPQTDHHLSSSTNRRGQVSRQQQIRTFLRSMNHSNHPPPDTTQRQVPNDDHATTSATSHTQSTVLRDVALLVHSPHANDDKLALVVTMASSLDMIVHVIQPSALLAKFGIYADVALSSIVHAILIQAAVRQQATCLIWDHWDDLRPSSRRNHTAMGDAANPILQSMFMYIESVLASIQNDRFFPFPRNNPLYHFNSTDRQRGMVLPVRLCWIAIMTSPDRRSEGSTDFDSNDDTHRSTFSGMGLYRFPNLTSETRYQAFRHVLTQKGMTLSKELEVKLPYLAAAAIWAHRAIIFEQCVQHIHDRIMRRCSEECVMLTANAKSDPIDNIVVRLEDVQEVFQAMQQQVNGRMNGCNVQFVYNDDENTGSADRNASFFNTTVGGNQAAKESLEDALCFDPVRRNLLQSFGIAPSTGLLLYGPPGTGKSLLWTSAFAPNKHCWILRQCSI